MNRYLAITVACCALIALTMSVGTAAPSFRGYTGLVKIPNADTLSLGQWNVGIMTEDVEDFNANDIFANYGIADNLEIGVNAFQRLQHETDDETVENTDDTRTTLLNAKYTFKQETCGQPGIAVGVIDITNGIDTTPYVVLSKVLSNELRIWNGEITNFRGHIGLAGGQFDGVFVGFNAFLGNRVNLMFEWDSHDPNVGARFTLIPGLRLHAALFDVGGRDDFGLGASYQRVY